MGIKGGVILTIGIFLISFISASFQVGNVSHFIETQYSPSEKISGWMNISLEEESGSSLVEDSNGNSLMILDLLRTNENLDYSCNTQNCTPDYATEGESKTSLSFSLGSTQKKVIGVKLKGDIKSISSLALKITSDATPSCYNQLEIDLLDDNSTEFINQKVYPIGESSCESFLTNGCFNVSKNPDQYSIGKYPSKHCQKINLSSSPSFKIGAWINNQTNDKRKITMALYDLNMEAIENSKCTLPPVIGNGSAYCIINYTVKKQSPYFLCIYSNTTGNSTVRGYSDKTSGCGFYQESENNPQENAAFDIFVQGLGFDSVGEIKISDSSEENRNKMKNYIYSKYGSYDCNENICIIPISIKSNKEQNILLENFRLNYVSGLGPAYTEEFYSANEVSPRISSGFQKIFLDYGNFGVPASYGIKKFEINLNDDEVFSESIEIKNLPKIINLLPTAIPSLIPTIFTISTSSNKSISTYIWDFNDSTPLQKTTTNETTHTYNFSGNYNIKIMIQDSEGINVSKTFEVLATIPKSQLQAILKKDLETLEKIKIQIGTFDIVTQNGLNSVLKTEELEKNLESLQRDYAFLGDDSKEEDYAQISRNLSMMKIPEAVTITKKAPLLPFYPLENEIDLETLKNVGGGEYTLDQQKEYQNAVVAWQISNADMKVSLEEFSAIINGKESPVLNKLIINVKKNYSDKPAYLFIKKMNDLNFKEKYSEKESEGYFYWELEENEQEIELTTSEIIDFEHIPVFTSPEISELSIESTEISPVNTKITIRWGAISASLAILLFVAMIVYSLLSVWYKRRYESYLFKNRNDLYNLILYVNSSKKKGEGESIMITNLKRAGWTGEQITYVLKKYSGKRTGMIELPLTKFIDKLFDKAEKPNPQQPKVNPVKRPF